MKSKFYFTLFSFLFLNFINAQVGIGTTTPDAQLDIRSSNQATPSNTDGIIIPKVDAFPVTNPTAAQQGMLVYLTTIVGANQPGFYYWDNGSTSWQGIASGAANDKDWFTESTTTPPSAITDDMFHTGNVAIGKNTADYPLEVNTTAFDKGILNTFTSTATNGIEKDAFQNQLTINSNDVTSSFRTDLSGTGNGDQYGNYNSNSNSGSGVHYATYYTLSGTGTGLQYGNYSTITNSNNSSHFGSDYLLNGTGSGTHTAYSAYLTGAGTGGQYGNSISIDNSGNSTHYGTINRLAGSGTGDHYAISNIIMGTGNGIQYGVYNQNLNSGTGIHYGNYNLLAGVGTGDQYGNYTNISNSAGNTQYGSYTTISGNGFGGHTGNYNLLSGSSGGVQVGTYNEITNTAGSSHYGAVSNLSGTGAATKYGFSAIINTLAGGTHYGVYSSVLKAGATNFAGYFLGNVGIGTTTLNTYTFPPSRGALNQIMLTDAVGNVTWQNPSAIQDSDWFEVGTVLAPDAITDAMFHTGNVSIGKITNTYPLDVTSATRSAQIVTTNAANSALTATNTAGAGAGFGNGLYGETSQTNGFGSLAENLNANGTGVVGAGNGGGFNYLAAGSGGVFSGLATGLYARCTTGAVGQAIYTEEFGIPCRVNYWNGATQYKILGTGTVSTTAKGLNNERVTLHCTETPEIYFEDYGESQLVNGKIHIEFDPIIAKNIVVNEKHPLRVYIQLEDNCNGVYVTNKTGESFDVIELSNGKTNAKFQYHIIGNRADEDLGNGHISKNADTRFELAPENLLTKEVKPIAPENSVFN